MLMRILMVTCVISLSAAHAQSCDLSSDHARTQSATCKSRWINAHVRINQIQMIGTHNSYHLAIPPEVMRHFQEINPVLAHEVDYASHASLTQQLNMGMRQLEIDAYYDPNGGRYADPQGEHWIAQAHPGYQVKINPVMLSPGFKVLHMPDVDYRSSCLTYVRCLQEIHAWSLKHPGHLPIFIHGNAKGPAKPDSPDVLQQGKWTQTQALPFNAKAFDALDKEVLSVFKRQEIITPEDVIRAYPGLYEATRHDSWPLLRDARGKVVFVIDGSEKQARLYERGDPQMCGKIYFIDSHEPDAVDSGYTVVIDSRGNVSNVQSLVKQGFIVRTLADFLTVEPRTGDYSRAFAAFASGAQIISTDYYRVDPKFPFPYRLRGFPAGTWVRCNPINAPTACDSTLLDPYIGGERPE